MTFILTIDGTSVVKIVPKLEDEPGCLHPRDFGVEWPYLPKEW